MTVAVDDAITGVVLSDAPIVAGPENVAKARELVRGMKLATAELGRRAQAEKDGPGSKTWAQIADEFGCDVLTLRAAREAAQLKSRRISRSLDSEASPSDDLEPEPQPEPIPGVTREPDTEPEPAACPATPNGQVAADEPCLLNAYAETLRDMFAPRYVRQLTPRDRGNLYRELVKITEQLERAGIE